MHTYIFIGLFIVAVCFIVTYNDVRDGKVSFWFALFFTVVMMTFGLISTLGINR